VRQVFFHIPPDVAGLPVFGFGWLLLAWTLLCVVWLILLARKPNAGREILGHLPMMLLVGGVLALVLPRLQEVAPGGEVLGLPIRGYGVMLLLAFVAGVGLSMHAAQREGIEAEVILSLAFWMILAGIAGARLFFVIEYWETFRRETVAATLFEVLKFTEGGLVVYGSVIGGLLAAVIFLRRRELPLLKVGDLIAPGMLLGLSLGRIGCLLNGCCWGGPCDNPYLAIRFPEASPAYLDQLRQGTLLGMQLEPDSDIAGADADLGPWRVREVLPASPAERQRIQAGDRITQIIIEPVGVWQQARRRSGETRPLVSLVLDDGRRAGWNLSELPDRSGPLHPTQIYSSVNAALLALLLWAYFPFRRRDGEVFALMLSIYPVTRFLLERIRIDEPGQWGTGLTISQWVSLGIFALGALLWVYLSRQPRRGGYPAHGTFAKLPAS
jgi:phosphatidylglycerol:prolipoprotein diacylglycerol transferase